MATAETDTLRNLIVKRGQVKASVTRFKNYICSITTSNVDKENIRVRLDHFKRSIETFDALQSEIELLDSDEGADSEREQFETNYFDAIAQANKLIKDSVEPGSTHGSIRNSYSNDQEANFDLNMPKIKLPEFSGSYDEWLSFYDSFQSMVHNKDNFSDVAKLHYLKASLKGEAANLLHSLEITSANYSEAWEMLKNRYDNKRLIIQRHIRSVFEIPSINKESYVGIRAIIDGFQRHIRALKALKRPIDTWDDLLIHLLCSKLDEKTIRGWETTLPDREMPRFSELIKFLEKQCQALEMVEKRHLHVNSIDSRNRGIKNANPKASCHLLSAADDRKCEFCSKNHHIKNCELFLNLPVEQRISRIKERRLCVNCFKSNHTSYFCKAKKCVKCNKKHNNLLHLETPTAANQPSAETTLEPQASSSVICQAQSQGSYEQVFLATATVKVRDNFGNWHYCRALLDPGSQSNFITYTLARKLNLPFESCHLELTTVGKNHKFLKHKASVEIGSRLNGYQEKINCHILECITDKIPTSQIRADSVNIPKNIALADPFFYESAEIDMLIGGEIFWDCQCVGYIRRNKSEPGFQKTKFGWVVVARLGGKGLQGKVRCNFVSASLEQNLEKFWRIDDVKSSTNYSREQQACEDHFQANYSKTSDGRFVVGLPFKSDPVELGESRSLALKRFFNLEKRLIQQPALKKQYDQFMQEYIDLGHMREISEDRSSGSNFYLPHHGVMKEDSLTTKLRVVFDASSKSSEGKSLNDILMVGPQLQQTLFAVLVRYRIHKFVLNADIAKMYRQVLLKTVDTRYQRILWRFCQSDRVKAYELLTVTYGTAPASFLATRCLLQAALDYAEEFPIGSKIIKRDFYVDDLLTGASTLEELNKIREEVTAILEPHGFHLRKWCSNNDVVLKNICDSEDNFVLDLAREDGIKTLGLKWYALTDSFKFSINMAPIGNFITKRKVLSETAKIFDPLGCLTPIIVISKILLQKIWMLKLGWDEPLPLKLYNEWFRYRQSLNTLNELIVKRCVVPTENVFKIEIHGFCDASEVAYGACVYVRVIDKNGDIHVNLLCSRSRVSPLKVISIPRLELCGAVLLTDLMSSCLDALELNNYRTTYWTDSTIVLGWLKSHSRNFNVFVANRISHVQQATNVDQDWRHVSTSDNPADLISRGIEAAQILNNDLWWCGPSWLKQEDDGWPENKVRVPNELPEQKHITVIAATASSNIKNTLFEGLINKFSSFAKLNRVVAYCMRFCHNIKNHNNRQVGPLSRQEYNNARDFLVRIVQHSEFSEEIKELQKIGSLKSKNRLISLTPFLDSNNLLRVGGRLKNASHVSYNQRHPMLLPTNHPLTNLIIRQEHFNSLHAGTNTTLAAVRMNYWPLRGRVKVKKIIDNCVICFRAKPRGSQPVMADLPNSRVQPSRPFLISGVDYCGPFIIKEGSRKSKRTRKAYVAIFICLVTRAVHIEIVSDLTTDAFLAALKRFIARRGQISDIYCDNGTNFVGAREKLTDCHRLVLKNLNAITESLSCPINWHFSPANAPHFGGLWEAAVKSAKHHLKRVAGTALLTFEEMSTLMAQIESVLNSRPLTPLSTDPNDLSFLTPAHFLIGGSLMASEEPDYKRVAINRLSRWERVQQIVQHFWTRWSREYLAQFHQRGKWKTSKGPALEVGQLVLLRQDHLEPLKWRVGRVTAIHPGKDGITRAATVRLSNGGELERPANKLCVFPLDDNPSDSPIY